MDALYALLERLRSSAITDNLPICSEMNVRMFAMQTAPTPAATSPSASVSSVASPSPILTRVYQQDEVDKALLNVKNGIIGHNLDHQDNIKLLGDDIVGGLETNMEKVYRYVLSPSSIVIS